MIRVTFTDGSVREFKSSTYSIPGPNDATFSIFLTKSDGSIDKQGLACPLPAARIVTANVKTIERVPDPEVQIRFGVNVADAAAFTKAADAISAKLRTGPEMAAALQPEPQVSRGDLRGRLKREIDAALDQAIAGERVACADIADHISRGGDGRPLAYYDAARDIAKAIRTSFDSK